MFFLFGLVFGSFLNVCIYRMPRELSVVRPRSACPGCHAPIAWYDNIPVLSWLLLRGRCRQCKSPISARYAAVELLTGAFFALSAFLSLFVSQEPSMAAAIKFCVFSFLLIGLIFTDAETQLLPNLLTLPGIVLGLVFSLLVMVEGPAEFILQRWGEFDWRILSVVNAVMGAIFGMAFILGVAYLYRAVRGVEGMGMGDVKLLAMIGAFLGIKLTLFVLLVSTLVGSLFGVVVTLWVFRKRRARFRKAFPQQEARARAWHSATLIFRNFPIPFGVFLGTAALVAAFGGTPLIRWYMDLFG